MTATYLPVLGFPLQHHRVLGLADVTVLLLLDILGALLGLYAVILRECALVTGPAGVGEEVRSNRLDGPLSGGAELADGLEVLLGRPALTELGQSPGDHNCSRHIVYVDCS